MIWIAIAAAADDVEVREHLLHVAATLRAETPHGLGPARRSRRHAALDALESYAWAGDFPQAGTDRAVPRSVQPPRSFRSVLPSERAPRFVDADGTHCAVGYLMALDRPDLVERIQQDHQTDWLPAITTPGVEAWASEHGFSLDELAWIQPTYEMWIGECPDVLPRLTEGAGWQPTGCGATFSSYFQSCADTCSGPVQVALRVDNPSDTPKTLEVQRVTPGGAVVDSVHVSLEAHTSGWSPGLVVSDAELRSGALQLVDEDCVVQVGPLHWFGGTPKAVVYEACEGQGCSTVGSLPDARWFVLVGLGLLLVHRQQRRRSARAEP